MSKKCRRCLRDLAISIGMVLLCLGALDPIVADMSVECSQISQKVMDVGSYDQC